MLNALAARWAKSGANRLDHELAAHRAAGRPLIDLVGVSPLECGLAYPGELLKRILAEAVEEAESLRLYRPDPLGRWAAREAIAGYYTRRGEAANPAHIVLTPGTSFGYHAILSIIASRGDDILVPKPGYPLFDDLAALSGVRQRSYHLREAASGWELDPEEIAFQITPRTRALMLVSPHNPTGHVIDAKAFEAISAICREREIAIVLDEVFREFKEEGGTGVSPVKLSIQQHASSRSGEAGEKASGYRNANTGGTPVPPSLLFTLNGFSKMFSLPGMKVGWIKVDGDSSHTGPAMRALEHLSDTFLPMNETIQSAIAPILEHGDPDIIARLAGEVARRRRIVVENLALPMPAPKAGVYTCPRLPSRLDDEEFCLRLLREKGVLVHPGYFYDLPHHVALTCMAEEEALREGMDRMRELLGDFKGDAG